MQQRFETFTVLIAKISRSIRRIKAEEMSEFHLKGPHVSCLYYLTQLGPLTAGQLCDRCEEDKAAVSRSLEYLEQNGYVTRPDKRYRSPLTLTEKGQETGRAIAGKIDRLVAALAESSAVAVPYISQRIDALHAEREQLLHAPTRSAPLRRFDFQRASFDEKKLIAAEFVERIMLDGERVHIIWKA